MKRFYLLFLALILFNLSSFAQNYDTFGALFKTPLPKLNAKATDATKNYECNLDTLKEDSLKYSTEHQYGDVIAIYTACIQKYPQKAYLYNNRGNIYKMLQLYDEAISDYNKAIELQPNYISPYNGMISLNIMKDDLDSAMQFADKAIKISPKFANAYFYKGLLYTFKDDDKNAIKNYNAAIKYDPKKSISAYFYRGNIYFKQNNFKQAVKDYNTSLQLYENALSHNVVLLDFMAGEVYYNRGIAYYYLNNLDESLKSFYAAAKYFEAEGDSEKFENSLDLLKNVYSLIQLRDKNKK